MAEAEKYNEEKKMGCGLVRAVFRRRRSGPKKPPVPPLPRNGKVKFRGTNTSKKSTNPMPPTSLHHGRRPSKPERNLTPSNINSSMNSMSQVVNLAYTRKLRREPTFNSSELSLTISRQRQPIVSDTEYKASSSNIMLSGQFGNLKQSGTKNVKTLDYHLRTVKKTANSEAETTFIMGNIVSGESQQLGNIYSGVMNKLDPDVLKKMGNEKHKKGMYEAALALYDQAIALDSGKASYYSNKSAAFIGLGRLVEAVFECRKAIQIDPSYNNAHYRLARLYHRLGEADKALSHYKCSGSKAGTKDIAEAQTLQTHHRNCTQAQSLKDWNTLLKQSQSALSFGADSAQKIYAMQAEALLKLGRHQEAYTSIENGPNFDTELCTRFYGSAGSAYLLTIQAQVYMSVGRFEDAVAMAQRAARVHSSNEINALVNRARAVTIARSNGNQLFKKSKFSEACAAYTEGLEQEPYNSVLLCNRAACRSKLGQFEKAVEDCTTALNGRPSYSKARLRRANCNAQLERWEAAIQDYEMLIQETPGDEEVGRALFEAQIQLKKQRSNDIDDMNFGPNLIHISSEGHFRHYVTAPGMSVVLFCNKTCQKQVLQQMKQVCKRFPSVNFLKVGIEEHPELAKSEGVDSVPAFKVYKNGSNLIEIPGDNCELLESSVLFHSS
ncbi:unnamed protein product [Ilex paraguariensis]|uniref:Thioredoxin domain-containing protein n=1 Tax=Ilex paraguariensis TaxID=185542 RepID=A0ABC8THB6_9AQUA